MAYLDYSGLAGIFEFWENENLILLGLHGTSFPETKKGDGNHSGLVLSTRWAFAAARRNPLYLSAVSLLPLDSSSPLLCSWAGSTSIAVAGDPPAPRILEEREEFGNLGLAVMLAPSSLTALIPMPWPKSFDVDGLLIAADPSAFPDLLCKGAERYIASYDADADVITSWTAEMQGRPARTQRVTHLVKG